MDGGVKPLTPKQARFVEEYLLDLNATQAAIRAGYSAKTAGQIGDENLKKPEIASAVAKAMEERSARTKIDADWLLKRLAEEATADLADIYDDNGHLRPVADWPEIWRTGLVAGVETVRERDGSDENGRPEYSMVNKVKLSDRIKRLELIGRHVDVGAFRDKIEHTGKDGGPIIHSTDNETVRKIAAEMRDLARKTFTIVEEPRQ